MAVKSRWRIASQWQPSQQNGCPRRRTEGPQRLADIQLHWTLAPASQTEVVPDRQRRMVGKLLGLVDRSSPGLGSEAGCRQVVDAGAKTLVCKRVG